jgi:Na+-transporting methylmalonyl-CoA/oxaloacetate decarboxylase beta subunit
VSSGTDWFEVIAKVIGAFVSHPRWLIGVAIVLLFIGASSRVHGFLLIPIGVALLVWALILRARGE